MNEINTLNAKTIITRVDLAHLICAAVITATAWMSPHARADDGPRAWIYTGYGIAKVAQPISRMCFFRLATAEEVCIEGGERVEVSICVDTSGIVGFPEWGWCGPRQKLSDVVVEPFEPLPDLP